MTLISEQDELISFQPLIPAQHTAAHSRGLSKYDDFFLHLPRDNNARTTNVVPSETLQSLEDMDMDSQKQQHDDAQSRDASGEEGQIGQIGQSEQNGQNGPIFEFTFDCSSTTKSGGTGSFLLEPDPSDLTLWRLLNPACDHVSASVGEPSSAASSVNWCGHRNDSTSLSDSVQTFPEEFGRTYHAYRAGSYAFPNDNPEQERLEFMGECYRILMNDRLYMAPLSTKRPPRHILDIATGVGDWAIHMGDLFPESVIIGTDLSPIQPAEVPPNVQFYVEDSTDDWTFSHKFDYIHTRATAGCWSSFETQIAEQAFASLEPGGWFESQEMDCLPLCDDKTLDPEGPVATWSNDLIAASDILQRPAILGAHLKEIYERVGFVDVHQRILKMPINGWAKERRLKEVGWMWVQNMLDGLSGFSYQLLNKAFERTSAQIEVSLIDVRRDLVNPRIHAYMPVFVVWGRKPKPNEA